MSRPLRNWIIRGVARHRWYGLLASCVMCVIGSIYVLNQPVWYIASSSVLVAYPESEQSMVEFEEALEFDRQISNDAFLATVSESLEPRLERYSGSEQREKIKYLRNHIDVVAVQLDLGGTRYDASIEHPDRELAIETVTNVIATFLISTQSLVDRTEPHEGI